MSAARRGQHPRALPPATLDFAFVPALACECRTAGSIVLLAILCQRPRACRFLDNRTRTCPQGHPRHTLGTLPCAGAKREPPQPLRASVLQQLCQSLFFG